jgi:hypothetical protein
MATKKKRKKARSKKSNPTKRTTKKRAKRRNPSTARASAPRTKKRRSKRRNPAPKKRRARRASRRNPSGPLMQAALATAAGLVAFVAGNMINQVANSGFDPMVRRGIAAAGVVGGLALSTKKPLLGAGVAAGSAVMLAGSELTMQAFKVLPAKTTTGAVMAMGSPYMLGPGDERMGAVVAMGAPHYLTPGSESMGALAEPGAPYDVALPI